MPHNLKHISHLSYIPVLYQVIACNSLSHLSLSFLPFLCLVNYFVVIQQVSDNCGIFAVCGMITPMLSFAES